MTINEVAPPGFGHTKGDKGKGVKKGGTAAAFDKARKEGRFKGSKSDMFAIMWSQKNKGDKPHYKPGTDKKYKKYQGVNESVQNNKVDLILKTDVNNVLKQDNKDYDRGLLAKVNKDGSYDVAYWYDEYKAYPVEVVIDGKSIKKDAKNIHIKYHPELKKKNKEEAKDAMKEETSMPNLEKKDRGAIKKRFKGLFKKDIKGTVQGINEGDLNNKMDTFKTKAVKRRDEKSFGTIASATKRYELLKKIIGSKKKHDKPAIKK